MVFAWFSRSLRLLHDAVRKLLLPTLGALGGAWTGPAVGAAERATAGDVPEPRRRGPLDMPFTS